MFYHQNLFSNSNIREKLIMNAILNMKEFYIYNIYVTYLR